VTGSDESKSQTPDQKLTASELRYRRLFEAAQDGILLLNAKTGAITDVNPYLIDMLGYSLEEFVEKKLWEVGAFKDIEASKDAFSALQKNKFIRYENMPLRAKDGRKVQVEFVSNVYSVGAEQVIQCNIRDITQRYQAEDALRTSEERYRILFEESPISLWEEDFSGVKWYLKELQLQGVKDIRAFLETHPEQVTECVKQIKILDVNKATLRLYQAENKADILDHSERILSVHSYETIGDQLVGILQSETKFEKEVIDQTLAGDKIVIKLGWTVASGYEDTLSKVIVSKIDITDRKRAEEALIQAKEFAENVIQMTTAIFVQSDIVGNVQKFNPAAEEITGYSQAEIKGKNWSDILSPKDRYPYMGEEYIRLTERGEAPEIFENPILTKHGEERQILWKNNVLREGDKIVGTISFGLDITERKHAEEKIRRQLAHLTALSEIDHVITSSFDIHFILKTVLDHVITQLGVDAADVLLYKSGLQTLEFTAGCGFHTKAFEHGHHLRLGEGYAGRAVLERTVIHVSDLAAQQDNPRLLRALKGEDFTDYYAVPLIVKGQIKGVLEIFHRAPITPNEEWLDFLNTLARQAAIAIDSTTMFDSLQHSNIELALAYDATLEGWSRALDMRDKETEGHTQRVTDMTIRLARAFGLSESEMPQVRWGALLHDIGKMGVPDGILLKPEPLTDEEWVQMKKHPTFAYEMLSPITFLHAAVDIPYCHHEKWDGTGYPRGLKGEQIPLTARIFAVVDVWDALISDRPYRKAWVEEKVIEHIHSESGTHFDPQVVKVFLESRLFTNTS
jgi:PAS domain S-box-containing protein/putative nucleotidyltransferase with HDIG domain